MVLSGRPASERLSNSTVSLSLSLLLFVASITVMAGELLKMSVTDSAGVYQVEVETVVHAPIEEVWQVLTDYRHIYRLNSSIVESEILSPPSDSEERVRTVVNDCVFIFCVEIERVEDVRVTGAWKLQATVVRELSNIESGTAKWSLLPAGNHVHLSYQGMIDPGIAMFPVIGDYFARRKLRIMTLLTLDNLERIARVNAGLEIDPAAAKLSLEVP